MTADTSTDREAMGGPIAPLLERIAAREPTPGGGAVASWTGAMGAALGSMVVAYSLGREPAHDDELGQAARVLENARLMLLELAEEDAAAYADLSGVLKLKKDDPSRAERLGPATARAIEVPSLVAATCLNVLRTFQGVAPACNPYLRSDLGTAAASMESAIRGAAWMVRANLPLVRDAGRKAALGEEAGSWVERAGSMRSAIDALCLGA
jgi:formiminotetrahydrofolate cyclodeaminase